jgi:hypothetical protein
MKLLIKPLFTAVLVAVASGLQAAPPLPINPGLVDAMRPAAYRSEELSLSALEERLRETKAISPMKKLALKAEIDDLLARFRIAHAGGSPSLGELRDPYNRLLAKIHGMLKKDPQLARDIVASRESIWGVLADRTQFASLD